MEISYKKVVTGLRPYRIAVLMDAEDLNWREQVLGIIEWFSLHWGGQGNIIIPTDGKSIFPFFWNILIEYQPDVLCIYNKTDLDFIFSSKGRATLESLIEDQISILNLSRVEAEEEIFKRRNVKEDFQISPSLETDLLEKLHPFNITSSSFIKIRKNSKPLRDALTINGYFQDLKEFGFKFIREFDLSSCDPNYELYIRSLAGSSQLFKFRVHNIELRSIISVSDNNTEAINSINEYEILKDLLFDGLGVVNTPFYLTNFRLSDYPKSANSFLKEMDMYLIFGDSIYDYLLYYSMCRFGMKVYWYPKLRKDEMDLGFDNFLLDFIISAMDVSYDSAKLIITSHSLTKEYLEEVALQIKNMPINEINNGSCEVVVKNVAELLIKKKFIVYEEKNGFNYSIQQFHGNTATSYLEPLLPKLLKKVQPHDAGWIIDLTIQKSDSDLDGQGYTLPKNFSLQSSLIETTVGNQLIAKGRIKKNGHSFSFKTPFYPVINNFYSTIDSITLKPQLKLLDSFDVFQRYFNDYNISIEISDKGKYMAYSAELVGGIDKLAQLMKNEEIYKIFRSFLIERKVMGNRKEPGVTVKSGTYLSFADFSSYFSDQNLAREYFDSFLNSKILARGVILKCQSCQMSEWYNIDDLTQSFVCRRCDLGQVYTWDHWNKKGNEPTFYYRLNPMLSLGIEHNMRVPVLATNFLKSYARNSFLFTPELKLINKIDGKTMEIDICVSIDGEIVVGEAKSNGKLDDKQMSKYAYLVKQLKVPMVFATTEQISDPVRQKIEKKDWYLNPPDYLNVMRQF